MGLSLHQNNENSHKRDILFKQGLGRNQLTKLVLIVVTMARYVSSLSSNVNQSSNSKRLFVHWFRHGDMRLHDNPALNHCVEQADNNGILPMFCFDPRVFGTQTKTELGSCKCGPRRAKFILESVRDLRENMEKNGSGLLVAHGTPEDVFRNILTKQQHAFDAVTVTCQEETASEELRVDRAVKSILKEFQSSDNKNNLETVWGSTMYDPEDLPFREGIFGMPDTFTPFRNKVEKNCHIGKATKSPSAASLALCQDVSSHDGDDKASNVKYSMTFMPTLSDLGYSEEDQKDVEVADTRGVMEFKGGETEALARVKDYMWDKDLLKVYFDTRNGMLGADYSTKFSPWLAHGCLSPRYVAAECARYEEERVANKSTYWVVFELLWRDFWKFFSVKHGNKIFFLDGTLGREAHGGHPNSRRWGLDRRTLSAWKDGNTGYPLVDANMRELKATGFMSNRGRQNVCSFLALDTNTDWRYGADHFEQELLDYDITSNWGNWCAGAGMTGGRLNRFNIVKQSKDYDCDGDYVRHWCPELKNVPMNLIHEPWKMSTEEQEEYGVKLGRDYPKPIVPPFVPRKKDDRDWNSKGRGGRNNKTRRNGNNNNNSRGKSGGGSFGKGQRKEMKSLKQGSFKIN